MRILLPILPVLFCLWANAQAFNPIPVEGLGIRDQPRSIEQRIFVIPAGQAITWHPADSSPYYLRIDSFFRFPQLALHTTGYGPGRKESSLSFWQFPATADGIGRGYWLGPSNDTLGQFQIHHMDRFLVERYDLSPSGDSIIRTVSRFDEAHRIQRIERIRLFGDRKTETFIYHFSSPDSFTETIQTTAGKDSREVSFIHQIQSMDIHGNPTRILSNDRSDGSRYLTIVMYTYRIDGAM